MATFNNGESGLSVRNKLNDIINKVEGVTSINNDIDVTGTVTADGLTVDGGAELRSTSNPTLEITNTDTSIVDAQLYGSLNFVSEDGSLESGRKTVAGVQAVNRGGSGSYAALDFYRSLGTSAALTVKGMTIDYNGDISFYEDTGTTPKMVWSASAESLGIGTTSPSHPLTVQRGSGIAAQFTTTTHGDDIELQLSAENDSGASKSGQIFFDPDTNTIGFKNGGLKALHTDSSGNVGIGTSSPSANLHISGANGYIKTERTGGSPSAMVFGSESGANVFYSQDGSGGASPLRFAIGTTERMRIDSSGNVGIGVVPSAWRSTTDAIQFGQSASISANNNANAVSFTSNGYINSSGNSIRISTGKATNYYQYDGTHVWDYAGSGAAGTTVTYSEAMRIDASGNLLVGRTSSSGVDTDGHVLWGSGISYQSATSNSAQFINRNGTDGAITTFYKSGSPVGSIGSNSGTILTLLSSGTELYIGSSGAADAYFDVPDGVAFSVFTSFDNTADLGRSSARFDDIYATNAIIQTSDANEKQDIDVLSDAEQRVAVAAKGLLRKFRWNDAVAEKGDDARIHFGIIAQDLQAAFEAEGLDAGRYAMFIHSTWTDEETGEERSRMGVRYSELLAFIIAAI